MRWLTLQKTALSVILLALCFAFTSCLTPKKIDGWIDGKYGSTVRPKNNNNDYITIQTAGDASDVVATTEKRKTKLLPALFFWKWEYGTYSTLNQAVPAATVQTALLPYLNRKGLKSRLGGQKLELTFTKLPANFSVIDKGGLVFLVLFYFSWDDIFMKPEAQNMVVQYRVLKDGAETKTGIITVADRNKALHVKVFHSVKKTFWSYLDQYNTNLQLMSKDLGDQLMASL